MKKLISFLLFLAVFVLFPLVSKPVFATTCNIYANTTTTTKDYTSSGTCTVPGSGDGAHPLVDGLDKASSETDTANTAVLTVSAGVVTVNNTAELIAGSLHLTGGSIVIQTGGVIKIGKPLYMADADTDGYADSFTLYDATASAKRRWGLAKNYSAADCNTGSALVWAPHAACYTDGDSDGYTNGANANTTCLNTSSCATATKASLASNGAAVTTFTAGQLRDVANGNDCNDGNAAVYQNLTGYTDSDADGYGTGGSSQVCSGASLLAGYSANNSDCNDTFKSLDNLCPRWIWRMDETSGTPTVGFSPTDSATWSCAASGTTPAIEQPGYYGAAFRYFNGAGQFACLSDPGYLANYQQLSVTAWVYVSSSIGADGGIFQEYAAYGSNEFTVDIRNVTNILMRVSNGSNTGEYSAVGTLPSNSWHHIAAVFDGTQSTNADRIKLYVDDVRLTPLTTIGSIPSITATTLKGNLRIGNDYTGSVSYYYLGYIDDERLYQYALNQAQIGNIMNNQ